MSFKEAFLTNNGQAEFSIETRIFLLEDYADYSVFHVSGNEDQTLAPIFIPTIQTPPIVTLRASQAASRSSRIVNLLNSFFNSFLNSFVNSLIFSKCKLRKLPPSSFLFFFSLEKVKVLLFSIYIILLLPFFLLKSPGSHWCYWY